MQFIIERDPLDACRFQRISKNVRKLFRHALGFEWIRMNEIR